MAGKGKKWPEKGKLPTARRGEKTARKWRKMENQLSPFWGPFFYPCLAVWATSLFLTIFILSSTSGSFSIWGWGPNLAAPASLSGTEKNREDRTSNSLRHKASSDRGQTCTFRLHGWASHGTETVSTVGSTWSGAIPEMTQDWRSPAPAITMAGRRTGNIAVGKGLVKKTRFFFEFRSFSPRE